MEDDQSHKIVVVTDIIHRFEMPGRYASAPFFFLQDKTTGVKCQIK